MPFKFTFPLTCHGLYIRVTYPTSFDCTLYTTVIVMFSASSNIPPEILTAVASYLDEESLIGATCVCRFWREALLSFARLWSHLTFGEKVGRPLKFLEFSGSATVSVEIKPGYKPSGTVEKELKKITHRLTALRTKWPIDFIDELLASQPFPNLTHLDVVALPPVRKHLSYPLLPYLTHLSLELPDLNDLREPTMHNTGDALLEFIQNCPLLRIAYITCADFNPESKCGKILLPQLHSFTHQSPVLDIRLYNRLSLQTTCHVAFAITDLVSEVSVPWMYNFPALLPDVKAVNIEFHPRSDMLNLVRIRLSNSENGSISLDKLTLDATFSAQQVEGVLDFLTSCEMSCPVEILSFERCPVSRGEGGPDPDLTGQLSKLGNLKELMLWECEPLFFLQNPSSPAAWCPPVKNLDIFLPLSTSPQDLLERVAVIAASREMLGEPLNTVSLTFQDRVRTSEEVIERLNGCVGSVKIG